MGVQASKYLTIHQHCFIFKVEEDHVYCIRECIIGSAIGFGWSTLHYCKNIQYIGFRLRFSYIFLFSIVIKTAKNFGWCSDN